MILHADRWSLSCLIVLAACGGHDAAVAPQPPVVAAPVIAVEQLPASVGGEDDASPLGGRMEPRELDVPPVGPGRSATFRFDEGRRRGFVTRLPEHTPMHLLTPTYGRGRLYVGGGFGSHQLYGIDARTGHLDWRAAAPDGGPTAAIVVEDKVLYNTESCTLFAVDARTGRELWKRWLGDPLMGQAAAANGRVFSGHVRDGRSPQGDSERYGFTAMSVEDGRVLWTIGISADVMNAPVLAGESAYFTTMDGVVHRVDQATGRVVWIQREIGATSAPWLAGEAVHVSRQRRVRFGDAEHPRRMEQTVVLDRSTGEIVASHDLVDAAFLHDRADHGGVQGGWAYEGSRPTLVDGRSYQTIGDEVHCRDATTGELLWRRRYEAGAQEPSTRPASSPAVAGSQLVFGTRDGVLFGLDVDTGLTTFAYRLGEPIHAQPTVAHGWVYASTARGAIVGLEISDPTLDGWHMWGGDARHNGPVEPSPEEHAHAVRPEPDRPTEGTMRLSSEPAEGEAAAFPLVSTRVRGRVSGFVARVEVEQTWRNPFERPVEAVYEFPLPDDAGVDAMRMHVGDRVVHARIRRRARARAEYAAARERGALATILEQERPNLFRQSLANIRPGEAIRVVLRYTQVLPYEEGSFRFVFPMVAGPRYTPGEVTAPAPPAGARPDRVEVELDVDVGSTLRDVESPTHALRVARRGESGASITLDGPAPPDRDLDVRLVVAGDAPSVSTLASPPGDDDGFVTLSLHPRLEVPEAEIAGRELVLLVDTSSSMRGPALELAKAAMLATLSGARPADTIRLVRFSDGASAATPAPVAATPDHLAAARDWVRDLRALGATEMSRGIRAALDPPADPSRLRFVLLLTDGYIGNETEIFREVGERLGDSRLFAFGVGAAVNRYLLTRLAEIGRGDVQVVTLDEAPAQAAARFHARIARPWLTDVTVDWGDLAVHHSYPARVPDLFADRPLVVHGRYARGGRGAVTVRGRIAGRPWERRVEVTLPAAESTERREELESLWARARIRDRMLDMALRPDPDAVEEVTRLGLRHGLLTQWTAFVAIDEGPPARAAQRAPDAPGADTLEPQLGFAGSAGEPLAESVNGFMDEDGEPDVDVDGIMDPGDQELSVERYSLAADAGGCAHCAATGQAPLPLAPVWLAWLLLRRGGGSPRGRGGSRGRACRRRRDRRADRRS